MLYTPSHAELAQHPKTRKLARKLGVSIPTALGHLHLLWHFALNYAPDGDLARFDCDEIADGCMWEGSAEKFNGALIEAGWLDVATNGDCAIHDWHEHGGKYVQRKEANAQRMRDARAKRESGTTKPRATHVRATCVARVEPKERRGEENRVEKKREEEIIGSVETPRKPRERNPHWDALSEGLGFTPTTDAECKRFGKIVGELKTAGITPTQIHTACENYSLHFSGAARTPEAILKHISQLQTTPLVRVNGHRPPADALEARFGRGAANTIRSIAKVMEIDDEQEF